MSKIEDGGPAFPTATNDKNGITVRDYFAAKAMEASLTAMINEEFAMTDGFDKAIAKIAYVMADLMLKERAK